MTGAAGRPLRAFAVLAVGIALWFGSRLPGMQADAQRLALMLAQPMPVQVPVPVPFPLPVPAQAPPLLAALGPPVMLRAVLVAGFQPPAAPAAVPPATVPAVLRAALPAAAPPAPSPRPAAPSAPPPAAGFDLANRAYALKQAGRRREAAALFEAAIALDPGNRQWRRERAQLGRRWQMGGFALLRGGGTQPGVPGNGVPGAAASPVLGGGQVGGSIAFLPDPYARRPLAIVLRANMAADPANLRTETAQAAIGLRQTLTTGVTISAERLIALGTEARGDWTLRLAAGGQSGRLDAYAEAGVLGDGDVYGGAQASARLVRIGPAALHAASWASVQTGTPTAWRVDVGPSVTAHWKGVRLAADWRQRIAGNAAPGNGPAITVSAGF
jgi:hypothetical protein